MVVLLGTIFALFPARQLQHGPATVQGERRHQAGHRKIRPGRSSAEHAQGAAVSALISLAAKLLAGPLFDYLKSADQSRLSREALQAYIAHPLHKAAGAAFKEAIAERNQLAGMFGLGALAAMASTYHPLGVASYTTVNDRTVSVGALGMVFFIQPSPEK